MMLVSITRGPDGYAIGFYLKRGRHAKVERRFQSEEPGYVVETARPLGYLKPDRSAGRAWRRGWKGEVVPFGAITGTPSDRGAAYASERNSSTQAASMGDSPNACGTP